MGEIRFLSEQIPFKLKEQSLYRLWIERVILAHHKFPADVQFIFCSDVFLAELNLKYLQHNSFTDIITFNYNTGHYVSGDIFISIDRVKENSVSFKTTFEKELERVMIHGILHLLGFNDKSQPEKKKMTMAENESLEILSHTMVPRGTNN